MLRLVSVLNNGRISTAVVASIAALAIHGCAEPACDCPAQVVALHLTVVDATSSAPVANVTATVNGAAVQGTCADTASDASSAGACHTWQFIVAPTTVDPTVVVTAPGYASQTITPHEVASNSTCCTTYAPVAQTVSLTAS